MIERGSHTQRLQLVVHVDDRLHVVGHGGDDAVDHVHDAIGGVLVGFDQTSTVDRDNLREEEEGV